MADTEEGIKMFVHIYADSYHLQASSVEICE